MPIILVFTSVSLVLALTIVFIDSKFNTEEDIEKEIEKLLPGLNCGICGYQTCAGMASVLKEKPNEYPKCRPLRNPDELVAYLRLKKILDK